jgi:hypothetical protein
MIELLRRYHISKKRLIVSSQGFIQIVDSFCDDAEQSVKVKEHSVYPTQNNHGSLSVTEAKEIPKASSEYTIDSSYNPEPLSSTQKPHDEGTDVEETSATDEEAKPGYPPEPPLTAQETTQSTKNCHAPIKQRFYGEIAWPSFEDEELPPTNPLFMALAREKLKEKIRKSTNLSCEKKISKIYYLENLQQKGSEEIDNDDDDEWRISPDDFFASRLSEHDGDEW